MCMKISKEDIVRIAKGFDGNLRNSSSLDFALEKQEDNKLGEYKKLAYLLRAILVDHPFSDGNKKTAMFVAFNFAEQNNKQVDEELLKHHILSIASKNITEIRVIEERMKNAIK
jgi:prophage maintenance system killer protein